MPQPNPNELYHRASMATANDLRSIAFNLSEQQLSALSLPQVEEAVDAVSRVIPAGNVPGLILSGLSRLPGQAPTEKTVRRDIGMIFRGMQQVMDKAVYSAFFAGPAAVIWGYQNLLKLAGKDPDAAFPEGTWQFYVDYALREDTARHTNETIGFDRALEEHQIRLSDSDRITAWVMTAIHTLHDYHSYLENEWRERVYTHLMTRLHNEPAYQKQFGKLYSKWQAILPYQRMADSGADESYPQYRRRKFDEFLSPYIQQLSAEDKRRWLVQVKQAKEQDLPSYLRQMSIRGFLNPDVYGEVRESVALEALHIAVIYQRRYYLFPVCLADGSAPDVDLIRSMVGAMYAYTPDTPATDLTVIAQIQRAQWQTLTPKLPQQFLQDLGTLKVCPIIINADRVDGSLSLAQLRQTERGVGDHALTIFDSGKSFCFDQSHIYFDGSWGAALAEIMTNEALGWAVYLHDLAPVQPTDLPFSPRLEMSRSVLDNLYDLPRVTPEASAENASGRLDWILALRRLFKQRSDLLQLTVNDLLVLYRAIHAISYQPSAYIIAELDALKSDPVCRPAVESALKALKPDTSPPAILIPVDASQQSPRDRLYPMSFEVPLVELRLRELHQDVMRELKLYEKQGNGEKFDKLQKDYLGALAGFGAVMTRAKEIANAGESASVGTIKLLAHMPVPLQHLLDKIPGKFDVLNDIIKGREVFSNVGQVAPQSTLRRFITAKDDNEKKTLAWGVISDADNTMRVTLRDFRPHVAQLQAIGQANLAQHIAQDYLDSYVQGLNQYIHDIQRITLKSRETRIAP